LDILRFESISVSILSQSALEDICGSFGKAFFDRREEGKQRADWDPDMEKVG
jgi:hypothetical protein